MVWSLLLFFEKHEKEETQFTGQETNSVEQLKIDYIFL